MTDTISKHSGNSETSHKQPWAKLIIHFVLGVLILDGLLFISAGRLNWVEGWIFSSFYIISTLIMVLWALRKDPELMKERQKRGNNIKRWDKVIIGIYTPTLIALLVIASLDAGRFEWSSIPLGLQVIGFVGFIPALAIPWWAMAVNTYLSSYARIQNDRGHQVITTGPYRYVRHPLYAGLIIFVLCIPLFLGSWWALIPSGMIVLLFIIRTMLEDKMLQEELNGYKDYTQQVRYRLLPGVW